MRIIAAAGTRCENMFAPCCAVVDVFKVCSFGLTIISTTF